MRSRVSALPPRLISLLYSRLRLPHLLRRQLGLQHLHPLHPLLRPQVRKLNPAGVKPLVRNLADVTRIARARGVKHGAIRRVRIQGLIRVQHPALIGPIG